MSDSPAAPAPDARLAEVADLLARGYRRLVLARQKGLALSPDLGPSCGTAVNTAEITTPLKGAA